MKNFRDCKMFRKRAGRKPEEEKLFSQTALFEAQLNSAIDGILVVDQNQKRILINRRMIEMFKVPLNIAEDEDDYKLLKHVTDLTKNSDKFLEKVQYLYDHPIMESSDEVEFINGMIVDRYSAPVIGRNGKNYGRIWTFRDISERKNAENKVREKDIQFEKLLSQVPDLIYQFTRRPDGTFCVPIASAGIINVFGCSPEDVSEDFSPIGRVLFPEDSARVISDIEYSAKHLTNFNCEFRVQISGRELQWILAKSVPEKLADGSITWYGFTTNITELKYTEQALIKAKEKAEESDKLKSAFLANMSHEIRTPMNGILGFAGLLKQPGLSGEEQQNYMVIMVKSGARMLNIINNIIDYSKIEAGQMEVELSNVNVNTVTEYFYTFFKSEAELKGIQLFLKNSLPATEAVIISDSIKFDSILSNLIKNAIKYTHSGSIEFGYTIVETLHATSQLTHHSFLQFFVKDTGIGIPGDRQKAIFERFIQADISDKQAFQGAGLGLSIARAYVEMLGGKIWVDSEPGKGSVFYFTIPYNYEPQEKTILKNVVSEQFNEVRISNLKILIAEDDETSEMFISSVIKEISDEVFFATTGIEAIEACRNNPGIDLVLMDIQMPDMNGYEATRQIRQFNKDVVIIAQTAFGLKGDREKSIEAGCNDYIAKPIDSNLLLRLIQKYFNK